MELIKNNKKFCLYVLENDIGNIKIGISGNLLKRIRTLELSSGIKIKRSKVLCVGDKTNILKMERETHLKYNSFRLLGEWFSSLKFEDISLEEETLPEIIQNTTQNIWLGFSPTAISEIIDNGMSNYFLRLLSLSSHRGNIKTSSNGNQICLNWSTLYSSLGIKSRTTGSKFKKLMIKNGILDSNIRLGGFYE